MTGSRATIQVEPKRSMAKMLVVATVGLIVLWIAARWLLGASPYVQYMELVHEDVPPWVVPVRLEQGVPATFQARIIYKRRYGLNLLDYFSGKEQRAVVEGLIGGAIAQPINAAMPPGKLPITFRITVQNQDRRILHDETVRTDGRISSASRFIGRRLSLLPSLDEALYAVSVTPLSDVSGLAAFRTGLELTFQAK